MLECSATPLRGRLSSTSSPPSTRPSPTTTSRTRGPQSSPKNPVYRLACETSMLIIKVLKISKYIMSHSKCHFSHSGSCTRISYLHILENHSNLHKRPQILFGQEERCADKRMRMQLAGCEKNVNVYIIIFLNS